MKTAGIILTWDRTRFDGLPRELLPIDKHAVVIDSQLTAMRFAGIQEIYVLSSVENVQTLAYRFANKNYESMGIFPRILVVPTKRYVSEWDALSWGINELDSDTTISIGMGDVIVPPDCYYESIAYSGIEGVRVGKLTNGSRGTVTFRPEAAEYIKHMSKNVTFNDAIRATGQVYDFYNYPLQYCYKLDTFEAYMDYTRKRFYDSI